MCNDNITLSVTLIEESEIEKMFGGEEPTKSDKPESENKPEEPKGLLGDHRKPKKSGYGTSAYMLVYRIVDPSSNLVRFCIAFIMLR